MPRGTSVHQLYEHLRARGYSEESAAKIAQAKTGLVLQTGKPPKREIRKGRDGKTKVGKYA